VQVICDNCGKKANRTPRQVRLTKRHFCSRDCFMEYRMKKSNGYATRKYDSKTLNRIKYFGEVRKQMVRKSL